MLVSSLQGNFFPQKNPPIRWLYLSRVYVFSPFRKTAQLPVLSGTGWVVVLEHDVGSIGGGRGHEPQDAFRTKA